MKQYTHAWLAFMAIKRLERINLNSTDRNYAQNLIDWFKEHKDGVPQGAWYPDMVIKDMANSHVLKFTPSDQDEESDNRFKRLPTTYLNYKYRKSSPLWKNYYIIEEDDNLPDRCESIAHSVIDNLKMQETEDKGSPVSPTDNHLAILLFMLSHYVADAHMPLHCDSRQFSEGKNIHAYIEKKWEDMIKEVYEIDADNDRFKYDPDGYPLLNSEKNAQFQNSFLFNVNDDLINRKFIKTYGANNNNVWDFMSAICQYSYILSHSFIPDNYTHKNITNDYIENPDNITFDDFSRAVFSDTIDSIARIWFHIWVRYMKWERQQ